jgi:hypothetical protein
MLPYLWRLFQCLRQYKDTKEKTCLLNGIHSSSINYDFLSVSGINLPFFYILNPALKYSTAIPVIFLSALKYHVHPDQWVGFYRPLWLISSVVNSLYSFYWDIKRDWDLRSVASLHGDFTTCSASHTSLLLLLMNFALHTCSILTRIFMFKNPSIWTYLLYGQNWVRA